MLSRFGILQRCAALTLYFAKVPEPYCFGKDGSLGLLASRALKIRCQSGTKNIPVLYRGHNFRKIFFLIFNFLFVTYTKSQNHFLILDYELPQNHFLKTKYGKIKKIELLTQSNFKYLYAPNYQPLRPLPASAFFLNIIFNHSVTSSFSKLPLSRPA